MKRKSVLLAVVVASLFMLGIMIFQGEAPAVVSLGESSLQIIENPVDIPRVADEVDAAGNMLINVNENPSFEDWTGSGPASYDWASATAYREADFAYSGSGVTGNYGLLIESESSSTTDGGGYVSRQIPSSPSPLVEPGISLSFDWNVLENQAYDGGGRTFIIVSTYDGVSKYRNINYILSGNNPIGNYTSDAYFYLNDTLDEWHSFSRSITDDYIAVWGAGDLSSSQYVAYVQLKTYASAGVYGIISVAFDNIVLTDGSYSSWIANGDFETGTQSPWDASRSSRAYLEQSTDSTHETYSLNMSIPEITAGSGNVNTYKEFDYPGGFFASSPGMMYFDIDWKYNDTPSASHQSGRLTLWTRNTTSSYWLSIYFGTMDNTLNALSNYTSQYFFKMPGFGTKDIWQYTRIDIYDYLSSAGFSNVSLYQVEFAIQNSAPGASVFLLLDDFQIITYPLGDPGFEEDWYQDAVTPFAGWDDYNGGPTNILRSTDAYQGNYACKLTGVYQNTVGVYRDEDIPVNRNDLTNFSWRIDTIGNDNAWAIVRVLFTDSHYFNYLLGGGSSQPFGNASASCTFYVESFNNTGTWNLLQRNLTADYEAAFGSSANLVIDQLVLRMSVGTNGGLTILFDEMHFVDGVPPVIDSVSTLPTVPMYYDYVQVNIYAHDDRTGIAEVYVDYYNGTGWNRLSTTDMVTFYAAVIPSLPYNTSVIYLVTAVDNGGLSFTDSRWFSYTVGDDVAPTLTINEPSDMADAEDSVVIVTSPDDDGGSGIDYVEFRADTTLYSTDHTFPYSVIMDVDSLSLGTHMINVTAYDIAGNAISDDVTINVVDTTTPTIDSPGDISYSESTSGHWIAWTPDDARPDSYEVFLDGVSTYSNTWNSTSETIDILLDGLSLGEYNYTCVVYDDLGLWIADTVLVTVIDGTVPTLDSPPDVEFTEGTSGHLLTWHPDDLHPVSYSIEVDEVELLSGQWNSSSEIITFSLDALTVGSHNVTLIVTDIGGNSISDGVSVTVLAVVVPTTTTTPPTTTTTTITTTPTTPPPSPDIITIAIIGGVGLIIVVVIAIVFMKKSSK